MPSLCDFTVDNLGSPDMYTVKTPCRRITIQEKDRTAATLAIFNVYIPAGSSYYEQYLGGEKCTYCHGGPMNPGYQAFAVETVNVAAAVFTIRESTGDM